MDKLEGSLLVEKKEKTRTELKEKVSRGITEDETQKKVCLTIEQRLKMIDELESGLSATSVADKYGVTTATIYRINKNKEDIRNRGRILKGCEGNIKKTRYKGVEESILEKSVYEWFVQRRSCGVPVTGVMLQEKAKQFNILLSAKEEFKASSGWLHKFKKRHGIRCLSMHGEKLSADVDGSEEFKLKFNNLIDVADKSLHEIYNADETGLYWRMLPDRTLAGRNEKSASGRKKPKARITAMVCTNASGSHKLSLFIIGHSHHPYCFRGAGKLPITYRQQDSAWMTTELMVDYLQSVFIPEVKMKHNLDVNKEKKIILILDNAQCHATEKILNSLADFLTVYFLPPNVTSLIQPMDQGVIEKFKRCYKKLLVEAIMVADSKEAVDKALKAFNLWNCVNFAALAWGKITDGDIRNCWKPLIPLKNDTELPPDMYKMDTNLFEIIMSRNRELNALTPEEIEEWLSADSAETGWQIYTDNEIILQVIDNDVENSVPTLSLLASTEETNDHGIACNDECFANVTTLQALEAANILLNFYERGNDTDTFMPLVIKLSEDILGKLSFLNDSYH